MMLTWNVKPKKNTCFNSPVRKFDGDTHKVFIDHGYQRILGSIKHDEDGSFPPKLTTFDLKNSETDEIIATFNLDLA